MDPRDIYFVRLYIMIVDTCRSVIWELLLQMVQPPDTVINLVEEKILEDSKTTRGLKDLARGLKDLVEFWEKIKTTTPIETDFDITNLCKIILYALNKQSPRSPSTPNVERVKSAIIEIKKKRDNLSHTGDILMSEEMYQTEYMEIRNHVDLLENTINSNYNPDSNCKWIRRNSSKYLNRIDRIHKEYIDPHASLEIMKLIRQCREELAISEQEEQDVEQDKEETMDRTEPELVDSDTSTEGEVECDNQSDEYEKENTDETLQKMDDILGQADENEDDLFEQVQRQKAETDREQTEIKELKSLVNIQNQAAQKAELGPDGLKKNSQETETETGEIEESDLTEDQKRQFNDVLIATKNDIAKCEKQQIEEMDFHLKKYKHQVQIEEKSKTDKMKIIVESYELMFAREKTMFEDKLSVQRREIEREKEKLEFQLKRDIAANVESKDKEKEINDMKRALELKKKDSIDKIESDYKNVCEKLDKDKRDVLKAIERDYKLLIANVEKELEENKSHSLRKLKENVDKIKCKSNDKIKELKTNYKNL